MSEASNTVKQFLTENPRWIGVLFAAFVLISSSAPVAAGNSTCIAGP